MKIQSFLESYGFTQQELADFTGIPRSRIQKWVQQDKEPPKGYDINLLSICENFFATVPPDQAKEVIKNYRIIMGNVEPLAGYEATIRAGEPMKTEEEQVPYGKKNLKKDVENGDKSDTIMSQQNFNIMLIDLFKMIKESNENMGKLVESQRIMANAQEKMASAQETNSNTINLLTMKLLQTEGKPFSQALAS